MLLKITLKVVLKIMARSIKNRWLLFKEDHREGILAKFNQNTNPMPALKV